MELPRRRLAAETAIAAVALALATLAVFWPAPLSLGSTDFDAPGPLQADSHLITWILAWDVHALATQPWALYDANQFHPAKNVLAGSEHMLGHLPLFAPVYVLSGNPVLAIQFTRLASVWLCGVSMFVLLRHWSLGAAASFFGAFVFALCPARYRTISELQLIALFYLPVALLFLDRGLDRGRWRDVAGFAVSFAMQLLTSYYVAYVTVAAVAAYGWVVGLRRWLRGDRLYLTRVLLGVLASSLVFVSISLPYLSRGEIPQYDAELLAHYSATWRTYFWRPDAQGGGWAYLGVLPAVSALVAFVTALRRRSSDAMVASAAVALLMLLFTCGPFVEAAGWRIPLPYAWASALVPGFASMRVPLRFTIGVAFAVAALAGFGYQALADATGLARRLVWSATMLVVVTLCTAIDFGHFSHQVKLVEMINPHNLPPVYERLRSVEPGPVVEFPIAVPGARNYRDVNREARYVYLSTYHWNDLLNGYTGYPPAVSKIVHTIVQQLPNRRAIQLLRELTGLRYVVLHTGELGWGLSAAWREPPGLERLGRIGSAVLFEVEERSEATLQRRLLEGPPSGRTLLDHPAVELIAGRQRVDMELVSLHGGRRRLPTSWPVKLVLRVRNRSPDTWPVLTGPSDIPVDIECHWLSDGESVGPQRVPLPWDLQRDEEVLLRSAVSAPRTTGAYTLACSVGQGDRRFAKPVVSELVAVHDHRAVQ